MPSLLSRVLVAYLRITRRKRPYLDPRVLRRRIEAERRTVDPTPPRALRARVRVDARDTKGIAAYTLSPLSRHRSPTDETRHILYLHGGCYLFDVAPQHWSFCASLVERLGCTVTLPIYPLAPEHGVDEVLKSVTSVYRALLAESDGARIAAVMGDSAGGGMALALAQGLQGSGLAQPEHIVLLSPWLDVAMDHPEIPEADANDPWLSRAGLVEAGRMYARDVHPKDPRVSPLHGELAGLGALSLFIGTRDVLLPDARALRARVESIGGNMRMFEYEGMVHDFMLISQLPEAKRALADIVSVLR